MRIIEVEKKPLFFEEEKLSPEERKYRSAVKLMESVDCVVRFERAVDSLESAAALFEELGDYKESARKSEECRAQSKLTKETGIREAYQEAVILQENAKNKVDYRTVISEFERFPDYRDSRERIGECKKILTRIASRQAWLGRGTAVLTLIAIALLFWISPAKPYAKGYIRMKQGRYRIAVKHFNQAGHFLNAEFMKKKCRYKQALRAYEAGDRARAMQLCRMADGRSDADLLLTRLEIEDISGAKEGDTVIFGKGAWQVLKADGEKRFLLLCGIGHNRVFGPDTNQWTDSPLRRWMNRAYKEKLLNQGERKLLQAVSHDLKGEKQEKLYLLSREEYNLYADKIMPAYLLSKRSKQEEQSGYVADRASVMGEWWLRDAGGDAGTACYVDTNGKLQTNGRVAEKKGVRPVIEILLDEGLLEDTQATTVPVSGK